MNQLISLPLRLLGRTLRSGGAILGILGITYFAFLALESDRSYLSLQQTERKVDVAQDRLSEVIAQREAIERKVVALRPDSIDGDLLDEQVRSELGFVKPNELVILNR